MRDYLRRMPEFIDRNPWIPIVALVTLVAALIASIFVADAIHPSVRIPARTQAQTWADNLKIRIVGMTCESRGRSTVNCALNTETGLVSVDCFTGCAGCDDAKPGDCRLIADVRSR